MANQNKLAQANLTKSAPPVDGLNVEGVKKPPPEPKVSVREKTTFSWRNVGPWDDEAQDKSAALQMIRDVETYVTDHFFGDWYSNTALVIGTSFFSYFIARYLRGGILSLGFILLFTNSVYRLEFRRFNRDIRDDMQRIALTNRLEEELETMEWLNSFLDKFWVIYMPALSEMVMFQANEVLKDQAPGFGIEALSLDEFTLGSKAPRVDSIKSYTRKGHDHIEMDWAFSFTPNDTDNMTKNEIKKKINPKVALGVTVGKAFILKLLPILVEDMSFTGRMNIKLKLNQNFPHVKMVLVQFLEAPTIDYALKPVGGDTLGLDIMSFIPGLLSFVNGLIHSNLRPMLYAPNSLDIDVEEIMAQQSKDLIGVIALTIKRLTGLKTSSDTKPNSINPYVQVKVFNNAKIDEKTATKKLVNDPVYLETKYILVNALDGNHLNFNVFHLLEKQADDQLIGNFDFPLVDLLQKEVQTGLVRSIKQSGKTVGKMEFDLRYFPTLKPQVLEDGTKEEDMDLPVGILKLNLHEARDLDISKSVVGLLNPYAEIYVNDELVKTTRTLKQLNEPTWGENFETLVTQQASTRVRVLVKDAVEDEVVAKLDANIQDLIFETARGQQWITTPPLREGGPATRIRISAGWKALGMTEDAGVVNYANAAIGGLRLHVRSARNLVNLELVGEVDPYVRILMNGKLRGRTKTIAETVSPNFNNVFFLPVTNENQHLLLEVMDAEPEGKDRLLGLVAIAVNDFLKKNSEGYYLAYDGSNEVIEQPVLYNSRDHGSMAYLVLFVPTIPVYTRAQLANKAAYHKELEKKRKEEEEQHERDQKLIRDFPNDYEWVDIAEDSIPEPPRVEMPLSQAVKYRAGTVAVHVLSGRFTRPDLHVHTLFDDHAQPLGVSPRAEGRQLSTASTAEAFVRDLPNSRLIFRLAGKVEVLEEKEISVERVFDTLDILKKGYLKPVSLNLDRNNTIRVQLEFIPSATKLAPLDTVLDVGFVKLEILSASHLNSVDSNGKLDPLAVVKVDGVEVFRTEKKRKTLDPVWNEGVNIPLLSRLRSVILLEVYDWDLTHDDELLGTANLDLSTIVAFDSTNFSVDLDTQGSVNLRATFKPEYIRPKLGQKGGLPIDLNLISGAPVKLVGGAAGLAQNAVGSGVGLASDGVTKGGSFLKGLGRSRKKNTSTKGPDGLALNDTESAYSKDSRTGAPEPTNLVLGQVLESENGENGENSEHERTLGSPYTNDLQLLRSGRPPSVHAAPNVQTDYLPPPQRPQIGGHRRVASLATDASSFVESMHGESAIPGRVGVVSASGYDASSLEVKVSLQTSTKTKDLIKTRASKADISGLYHWNELVPFKSSVNGTLLFTVREHHRLGRSNEIGTSTLALADFVDKDEPVVLQAGNGSILVSLKFNH